MNRRPGEESDTESSRETSSDGSNSDSGIVRRANNVVQGAWSQMETADANIQRLTRLSLRNRPFGGSSSDESDICNPPDQLIFEYLEHDQPFSREPLADKVSPLSSVTLAFAACCALSNNIASCRFQFWLLDFQH